MYYEYELRTTLQIQYREICRYVSLDTVLASATTVCGMNEMNDRAFLSSTLKDRIFLEIKMCRVLCRRLYYLKS